MSQLHLMQSLKFTTEDLQANRENRISAAQRENFTPDKMNPIVVMVFMGHLLVIVGILVAIAIITKAWAMWIVVVIVTILMGAPFGFVQQKGQMRPIVQDDLVKGVVAQACGTVFLEEKHGRKPYVELTVEGVTLELEPKQATYFLHEGTYCVYYLPGSLTILSAEPMN